MWIILIPFYREPFTNARAKKAGRPTSANIGRPYG